MGPIGGLELAPSSRAAGLGPGYYLYVCVCAKKEKNRKSISAVHETGPRLKMNYGNNWRQFLAQSLCVETKFPSSGPDIPKGIASARSYVFMLLKGKLKGTKLKIHSQSLLSPPLSGRRKYIFLVTNVQENHQDCRKQHF